MVPGDSGSMVGRHQSTCTTPAFLCQRFYCPTHPAVARHVPPLRSTSTFSTVRSGQGRLPFQAQASGFSTSSSSWSMWAISWQGASHEPASLASWSHPPASARHHHAARASDSRPSTDSAWQDFLCRGVQHGAFDLKDGRGRAGGGAAGCGGAVAASERLLPLRAAAGAARGWPSERQAGRAWRAAGAGGAAGQSVERASEGR